MLDYNKVKKFHAMKLYEDAIGDGRVESAFFHTMKMVYLQGVEDGKNALSQSDPFEKIVGITNGTRSGKVDS